MEGIKAVTERYGLLERAAKELGFLLGEKEFPPALTDKHYFWSMQQIAVSGIGSIDYRRIYDNSQAKAAVKGKASYMSLRDVLDPDNEGRRAAVCATVTEVQEVAYTDKTTGNVKNSAKRSFSRITTCWKPCCGAIFTRRTAVRSPSLKGKWRS